MFLPMKYGNYSDIDLFLPIFYAVEWALSYSSNTQCYAG